MKHLLNTLFVTTEEAYASLDGENVVISKGKEELGRFPLHILQAIILFTWPGASPALMGKCAESGINLCFCTPNGRFLARTVGTTNGNVLLRKAQYRYSDDEKISCIYARNFIYGKINNCRRVLDRAVRDHPYQIDVDKITSASEKLYGIMSQILEETELNNLRGLEGAAATLYFDVIDELILQNKKEFYFHGRSRRPPLDNVNAMLSYVYTLLGNDCASALEAVGLDSYVGFLHRDRPGRKSLSQDLMEELRPCVAERFVLTLINNRILQVDDFRKQEDGAVFMEDDARKRIHKEWQNRKKDVIRHPFINEKMEWGMIPYAQALLLARTIRGDLEEYPPFLWR